MRKGGIINGRLMGALAGLGHTDAVVITDAGLPIPKECEVVDLALVKGIPSFLDVLRAVLNEIVVERYVLFAPMEQANPAMYETVTGLLPMQQRELLGPEEFVEAVKSTKIVVRSAEFSPCCNMILYSASGVEELCKALDVSC